VASQIDVDQLTYLNDLIENGGSVELGRYGPVDGAAGSDGSNCVAMLVRRGDELLSELLARLEEAIRLAVEEETFTDEVNPS